MDIGKSGAPEFVHAFVCGVPKLVNFAELDRFGRTRGGACRLQSFLLPVVAECAFKCPAIGRIALDHAERTGHNAVGASIANIGLNKHSAEFRSYNRACRTGLQTSCILAMLADVGRESPGKILGRISTLARDDSAFDEFDVAPRGVAELAGVIVGESLPVEAIARELVPFFAGNFTGFASDA
jgi:hypothetical protein